MHPEATSRFWPLLAVALLAAGCSDGRPPAAKSEPNAPSNLVATAMGGGVHLTWADNSDDEELFEIEREEGEAGSGFFPLDSVPFGTAVYHDSDVTLGTVYTYRVRAKLPTMFSGYSNEVTVKLVAGGGSSSGGAADQIDSGAASGSGGRGDAGGATTGGTGSEAGATKEGGAASDGGTANSEVSFREDVVPRLVRACGSTTAGCHNVDQAVGRIMPKYGPCKVIWYSAVDEPIGGTITSGPNQGQPTGCPDLDLYERLMSLHSMLCEASSWERRARYVVPGDLSKSLIYQVIAGDPSMGGACTSEGRPVRKMPLVDPEILPNGVELDDDGIAKIRDWILQGAKNN